MLLLSITSNACIPSLIDVWCKCLQNYAESREPFVRSLLPRILLSNSQTLWGLLQHWTSLRIVSQNWTLGKSSLPTTISQFLNRFCTQHKTVTLGFCATFWNDWSTELYVEFFFTLLSRPSIFPIWRKVRIIPREIYFYHCFLLSFFSMQSCILHVSNDNISEAGFHPQDRENTFSLYIFLTKSLDGATRNSLEFYRASSNVFLNIFHEENWCYKIKKSFENVVCNMQIFECCTGLSA